MAALGTIEDIARFDRMYQCGKDCCRGVRWKTSIQAFEAELFLRTAQSCCLVERAVAVIRDEQTKEALLRELDAATGAEDMTEAP